MVKPKKHLGQHFLTDPAIAKRITDSLLRGGSDKILEIGPGKGILTRFLTEEYGSGLICIEIDTESVEYLRDQFKTACPVIIEGNFLKYDLSDLFESEFRIIGNFPYNISSQIFFRILDHKDRVKEVICMIQKEVAERIVAPPGNKTYGILSVLLQTWYKTEYLFTVKPGSFFPKPDVYSAVIRLTRNERMETGFDTKKFTSIVKSAFNQRRKMLRNSLKAIIPEHLAGNPILSLRPEQLSADQFIMLTGLIK